MRLPRLQSAVMLPSRQHLAKSDFNGLSADPSVFAVPIETDFNPCNSGEWFSADGSKVWRIALCSPNAYSLNVALSDFYVPNGAELFVYDSDKKLVLGAFTSEQNTDWLQLPPVIGDLLVVEYVEPDDADFSGVFNIVRVAHDFRGFFASEESEEADCHIAVDSDFGADWQDEKRAVCQIIINGTTLCTGTLLATADGCHEPYVLTARHCIHTQKMAQSSVFYFNNEEGLNNQYVTGATLVAAKDNDDGFLDFALLKLNNRVPDEFGAYYAGWDVSGDVPSKAVCIHHPISGGKQLAIDEDSLRVASYRNFDENSFFNVGEWDAGTTEIGSSGAPIFDSNHRVVGILAGGDADCAYPMNDYFQMISVCYDRYSGEQQQLKHWLNPSGSNDVMVDGSYAQPSTNIEVEEWRQLSVYPNPMRNEFYIRSEKQMITSVLIADMFGRMVQQMNVGGLLSVKIDSANLPSGTYLCQVTFESGEIANRMIIKE